jgi:hypothetical protein
MFKNNNFIFSKFKGYSLFFFGDWGLGIGDWGLGPIPNPQSPIPNNEYPLNLEKIKLLFLNIIYYFK